METLRSIIKGHMPAACLLLTLTLCMKLVVPVGFMPLLSNDRVVLTICDGMVPATEHAAMHDMHGHHHGHDGPTKPDAPCPFAGLSAPVLGGTDPVQLAVALAAILIAGLFAATSARLQTAGHLRPPLRGPPNLG
ncbi:hypothetical protein [Sphingomonas bacterium]|uniref:hypothetical protein n=2 Tax=Sphingomonas TaxID=13687 RepID=UPI001575E5EB|nr:hypothetical protein [Sphingomonas bacterium]